ncbi:G/T mismatch-specific thymine DNA glycosylase [Armadillidium vulgare]|nr:G/T mismatch-specific thymine DNA glycosylase [Armadillidium vulgare]
MENARRRVPYPKSKFTFCTNRGELSPSKGCGSRHCSPERVGSPVCSPPRPPPEFSDYHIVEKQESPSPVDTTSQQETSEDALLENDREPLPEDTEEKYNEVASNICLQVSSPEELSALEEGEGISDIKKQSNKDEDEEENERKFDGNSVPNSLLCVNEEDKVPQTEANNYSLHSRVLEGNETQTTEEDQSYNNNNNNNEDQISTDVELSEHAHQSLEKLSTTEDQSQQFSESTSLLSNSELQHEQTLSEEHHRHSLQESLNSLEEHQAHLHNQHHQLYNDQQQCRMQEDYHYSLLKVPSHLQDPMRDQQSNLHDYDDHHTLGPQRHMQDPMGDHQHHPHHHLHPSNDRSHGYWNMHLGMLSKVKSETKDWYEREGMVPEVLGNTGLLKSPDQHDIYNSYRIPSHPSLGSESPRPSPIPHGSLPFSQSPDPRHQQHYQPYQNHSGMADMSPMSPKYQSHPRSHLQTSHHSASQISGPHGIQHPSLQLPSQHHPGSQHIQQQYGQQYGGQHHLNLPGHPGQHLGSPYGQGLLPGMPGGHRIHEGREGREGDPYSFVDEYSGPPPRPVEEILGHAQPKRRGRKPKHIKLMENGGDPLAIAAAQAAHEAKKRKWRQMGPDGKPLPLPVKPRKRIDRFDGISEDELSKKILPDHLGPNLDIVIGPCPSEQYNHGNMKVSKFPFQIGINPGLFAAYKGHHYAGPGNHFWKCLYLSGLIPEPLTSDDDHQLLDHGIGFTNIVARTTRGSAELTRKEIKEGGQILLAKLQRFQPRVAVFNGKGIYEIFSGKKEFTFGRQPEKIEGTHTHVWVMPSSSARCAQLPRALDKVPFYTALRKFRDFLKGTITELTEEEVTFTCPKTARHLKDCEKLDGVLDDELCDPFLDDPLKDDLESSRFESELDSEEISRSISQSLYNLSGMTREQLEALDCPTIPIRKKRGRPKKAPDDPGVPPRPKPRTFPTELLLCNGEEPPRKKRGRPKKVMEDGSIPPPKRPGRKPKALKEMLAGQQGPLGSGGIPQNPHAQMGIGHLNGMMSPSGYNTNPNGPPFSPQFGSSQVHPMNGPGDLMSNVHSVGNPNHHGLGSHHGLSGSHNPIHGSHGAILPGSGLSNIHSQGCPTPNSTNGSLTPALNLPPRGHTPQSFGQSAGYSSPVPNQQQQLNSTYGPNTEKSSELQLEEELQLCISPIPASPTVAQPDFEPPASLPEEEPIIGEGRSISSHQDEPNPSLPSQFSNPGTPAEENPSYQNYSNYPSATSCSPTYNSNIVSSPSYPATVSHSPSYPHSVSCSPSYTPHNTQSPSYKTTSSHSPSYHQALSRSPSYPQNSTRSPSYSRNTTQSPSYPPSQSRSPSYHTPTNHSPSFPPVTQSPSYPATSHSPTYPSPSYSTLTRSPSYPSALTQSPSYHPPTSHSPSFPSVPALSPSLNKPLVPSVHSPQMKSDVSSKSLSGLESLVDQIPSLNEGENGPFTNGPCSNPTTPCPPADPFSPGHGPQNSNTNNSYSPAPPGPSPHPYDSLSSSVLSPTFMGSSSMGSSMGSLPTSVSMSGSQIPYHYPQYGDSIPSGYNGPSHSFSYGSSGFHVPSPRFPYPSYPGGPYSQGYSQNSVLERIKQTGMGYGSF